MDEMKGYNELVNAIVLQAVEDYRKNNNVASIKNFFKSDWFQVLTNIDGTYLIDRLDDELNCKEGVI